MLYENYVIGIFLARHCHIGVYLRWIVPLYSYQDSLFTTSNMEDWHLFNTFGK